MKGTVVVAKLDKKGKKIVVWAVSEKVGDIRDNYQIGTGEPLHKEKG